MADPQHVKKLARARRDFPYFCRHFLRIRTKAGQVVPFVLNEAQLRLWAVVLRQLLERGMVRLAVLKARQLGISTFAVALIYWQAMIRTDGLSVYSLAQEDDIAKGFSAMVQRFQDHTPSPFRRQRRASEHKHAWDNGTVWEYGTASTPTGGRGATRQAIHFSEIAFWKHAAAHTTGSLQGLGDEPGSIAVYESTARGPAGVWYELWRASVAGEEDLEPHFLPWYVMPEYARHEDAAGFKPDPTPPNDHVPSEVDYQRTHGLTNAQMAWRRWKTREFTNRGLDGPLEFQMEYPATPEEAFATTGLASFISPRMVDAARRRAVQPEVYHHYPTVLGIDPAPAHGSASTAVIRRTGPIAHNLDRWRGLEVEAVIAKVTTILLTERIARVHVDTSEFEGQHIARMLRQIPGYGHKVEGVVFGGRADDRSRYMNVRAERWGRMAVWLNDPQCSIPNEPMVPGRPTLASELVAPERVLNDSKLIQLEPKKAMAARGVPSPDGADALCCTFARTEADRNQPSTWIAGMDGAPGRPALPPMHSHLGGATGQNVVASFSDDL